MDDDDLILNFAGPSESAVASEPKSLAKVSGGRWRERRNLQLKLQGRERKPGSGVNSIEAKPKPRAKDKELDGLKDKAEALMQEQFPKKREFKNSKSDKHGDAKRVKFADAHTPPTGIPNRKVKFAEASGERGGKNNSYVSSLFTSNKSASSVADTEEDYAVHQPSNAPLLDNSTFADLGLNERLATHLTTGMRYVAPTKVQRAVTPQMLRSQNDYFVKAQTGSGKTLAFSLPILHRLMLEADKITRTSGLFALILTPTRELAMQIYSVLESVLRCHHQIVPGIVVGGEKKKSEKARIRKGVNILVATPGRLADHSENTTSLDVSQVRWLILDEGDRLVELGFQETITKITDHLSRHSKAMDSMHKWPGLPTRRVNLLCSATMPDDVKKLGSTVLNNPQMISIDREGTNEKFASAPDQLVQKVMVVPPKLRLVTLAAVLKLIKPQGETLRTMVFFSCSDSVNFHFDAFARGGYPLRRQVPESEDKDEETKREAPYAFRAPQINDNTIVYRLHGSLTQQQRTSTLHQFMDNNGPNKGKHLVLFCTDVASRGLDLPNIAQVVEYDPPFSVDDHLHRIGRSARVGNKGEATLFLLPGEEEAYVEGKLRVVHPKESNLRIVNYEKILQQSFAENDKQDKKDAKSREGKWDIHATTWHLEIERWLLEDSAALDKALNAFISHIRAYATHLSAEKMYFNVKLLHLGHLAKAFGLRETPKKLGKGSGQQNEKKKENPKNKMFRMARMAEKANHDEFNY